MCTHMVILCARVHITAQMGLYFCVISINLRKDSPPEGLGKTSADEREEKFKTANEVWNVPQSSFKGRKKIAVLAACESHPTDLICCIFMVVVVL